ncbi:hypothetical protein B0H17DRAFT_1105728 [Mycena rosella]|uniref:Uncharacterized protein n=1 Tax=Mycena rosella TaxID=1033263 RepID=A0AAD7FVK0_MYCRO|nr:hypothetical protein B0H17DRAFT_1105728 [Mycena rosella]
MHGQARGSAGRGAGGCRKRLRAKEGASARWRGNQRTFTVATLQLVAVAVLVLLLALVRLRHVLGCGLGLARGLGNWVLRLSLSAYWITGCRRLRALRRVGPGMPARYARMSELRGEGRKGGAVEGKASARDRRRK